jgi:hypothetical protein
MLARAQVERGRALAGFMRTAAAERPELAIQTRGGWKMEVFSPVAVGAGSSNVRPVGAVVSRSSSVPSGVPHCCELSNPGEAVEIGKGSRLEQARPEHGLRRAGASSGEPVIPSCEWDDDPTMKMASSRWRSRNGSDCESSGCPQPAQAERGEPKPETAKSRSAPAANRASRLNRALVITPLPLSGEHSPLEAIGLEFAVCSPRLHWESRVREIDVELIYTFVERRFKTKEQKKPKRHVLQRRWDRRRNRGYVLGKSSQRLQ